jgi:hypothetical protein
VGSRPAAFKVQLDPNFSSIFEEGSDESMIHLDTERK